MYFNNGIQVIHKNIDSLAMTCSDVIYTHVVSLVVWIKSSTCLPHQRPHTPQI